MRAKTFLTAVFCGLAGLLPVVGVAAPKGLVVLLALAAVLAVPAYWRAERRFPRPDLRLTVALAVLIVWCAIASAWSPDPTRSLVLAVRIALILGAGMVLFPVAGALDAAARDRIGRWLVGGFALAVVLMAVELGLGYPLLRASGAADPGHELVWFNRSAVAMALIVWPVTAFLWRKRIGWKALALPALLGIASGFMASAAATLAFAAGIAGVLLFASHRRVGRPVVFAVTALVFGAMPFAAQQMHAHGWHRAETLAASARHRVEIWNFSAERIAEKPLLGWGFDGARHVGGLFVDAGEAGDRVLSLHPHNAPLQVMLELGAIGAVIALSLLWLVVGRLDALPSRARELGLALFLAALAVACVAYGMWQNWWLSLILLVALMQPLTAARDRADDEASKD